MKKYVNAAIGYGAAAMIGGVFYREFTKFQKFQGKTNLSTVHTHLFVLGMLLFLTAAALYKSLEMKENRKLKAFFIIYNIGVPLTVTMMIIRGVVQVLEISLSKAADASISGIAGIGHIFTGIGIICFLLAVREKA